MRNQNCWRLLIAGVISISCAPAAAQETFVQAPARLLTTFPITLFTGGVMLLRARLDNFPDTLNFILDTGSGGISLDSGTCEQLKLKPEPSDKTILGIAGVRQVRFLYNETLRLPGLTVDSLNFHVSDYGILTSVYGEKIDGIIGYSFFSRYIVAINYDSLKVSVYSLGSFRYPRGSYVMRPLIPNLPIIGAEMIETRKVNARFYFDTGAGLCALLSTDFTTDSNLLDTRKRQYLTRAQGLGGKATMRVTTIRELKLGPYRFHRVPIYIFDDTYNVTSYPNLGGLIGNDILRRFNVILNYDRRYICLTPNSHYHDLFDYSYSGLSLYWEDGAIVIGDIMPGSPAEKAGLQVDDVLIAVNTNFSNNIQSYKNSLQNAGQKVRMIIRRKGQLMTFDMKVKTID
ncbi:MAG TPA: aspartyl protease family protein [Puia sp.]|nr:aspartyl protease family protein [Puia sp.]